MMKQIGHPAATVLARTNGVTFVRLRGANCAAAAPPCADNHVFGETA